MDNKKSRKTVSYIISLLLTIFISIFIVITITNFTIMNPKFLIDKMNENNFFQQAVVNLNADIQQETQSTGFPIEMFENYINEESTSELMENYILNAFEGGSTTIDTSNLETKLETDINNYLESENIIINSEEQTAISILKTNIINYYQTYLTIPYLDLIINIINNYHSIYYIIAVILIILIIISSFILYRLYNHYRPRRRYFAYSLISSGLITFTLPAIIYFGKFVDKISLSPRYIYDFITSVGNTYLLIYVVTGCILMISGFITAYLKFKNN